MKKMVVLMLALAGTTFGNYVQAQESTAEVVTTEIPEKEYCVYTNDFWSNWFLSVGATHMSSMGHGESDWGGLLFDAPNGKWGVNLAIGKWFTPGLGMRYKFNGMLHSRDFSDQYLDFAYCASRADMMFNMSNLLCGYSETRVWNLTLFGGWGFIDDKSALDFGVHSSWRLGKRVDIFAEAGVFLADRHGKLLEINDSYEKFLDISIGFTFDIGKNTFRKAVEVDAIMALNTAQLDALNASLADQQAENARLKSELAKKPKEVIKVQEVYKATGAPQSVFFNIGSSRLVSKKEIVNLEAIANVAKENNVKVYVTGYADSATGSAVYNQKLSEKRAETVAKELEKLGLSRDNMVVEGKGGVSSLTPVSYNRRVIVEIK